MIALSAAALGVLCSSSLAMHSPGSVLERAPIFADLTFEGVESVITLDDGAQSAMAADLAARMAAMSSDNRIVAARVRGVPLASNELSERQVNEIQAALRHRGVRVGAAEARERYDQSMASLLKAAMAAAQDASDALSVYGLPLEAVNDSVRTVRAVNARFAAAIDEVDAIVSSRSFITVNGGLSESSTARLGLSEAIRLAGDRPVYFRANGAWNSLDADGNATVAAPSGSAGTGQAARAEDRRDASLLDRAPRNDRDGQDAGERKDHTNQNPRDGGDGADRGGGDIGEHNDPYSLLADVDVAWVNSRVEMRDAETGEIILSPRAQPLHVAGDSDAVVPTIDLVPVHGGFDLVYRFNNTENRVRPLGVLSVGIFTLGEHVVSRDFRRDGNEIQCDFSTSPQFSGPVNYPQSVYSPVGVLRNDRYVIGMSLHYPVLEYKHDVNWRLWSPNNGANGNGEGGRGWAMWFKLSDLGTENENQRMDYPAMLAPGEQRDYRVTIRVSKLGDDWMRTLLPYREYFHELYGPITYERNVKPVAQVHAAGEWELSTENPYGFLPQHGRPDLDGFGPFTSKIRNLRSAWTRAMIWKPSGVYVNHDEVGLPYQFTTNWFTSGTAMGDAIEQFSTVPTDQFKLGFWWGRSALVITRWNPQEQHIHQFDVDNPEHLVRGLAEVENAARAGATMIGLDNFMHYQAPQWELYEWLKIMQERYPHISFVGETRQPDFMHQIAPTFIRATRKDLEEYVDDLDETYQVHRPMLLADFMLPGHETWALISASDLAWYYRRTPTNEELLYEMHRLARLGYVSVIGFDTYPDDACDAAESWEYSVPADLRLEPGESP